jgi:molybdopterin molybdotransferase
MNASGCFNPGDSVLSADEARAALIAAARPLQEVERVPLREALGRVLAEDAVSPLDVPGHDNSAMDGYALRSADTAGDGARLPVSQRIAAGHPGGPLAAGTCARIFTGAPMPEGADAVVMQEEVELDGDIAVIRRRIKAGENMRPRANDVAQGATVLRSGTRIRPQMVGLLASLGIPEVVVVRRLRVALLNSGDEIVEPGRPLEEGQIYNSNRYTLTAMLQQVGCTVVDLGQIEDTFDATRAALREGARLADLIVTSGGVSVGEEDHIKAAVQAEGELHLWQVRTKPGKPLAYGTVQGTPFIGLPGNPVSVFVTLCMFGMPFIRAAQGQHTPFPAAQRARLAKAVDKPLKRREFVRVRLDHQADQLPLAEPFPRQGSDVLTSTVWADGLLEIPEELSLPQGAILNYWPFEVLLA